MAADPEQLYARLTSGDVGRIRKVAEDMGDASRDVDRAAERITTGLSHPVWAGGLAQLAFVAQGQQAFLAAATASWKLVRGAAAVETAAAAYDDLCDLADSAIKPWRQRDPALTAQQLATLRTVVGANLRMAEFVYTFRLASVKAALAAADGDLEDWFRSGAAKDYWFAVRNGGGMGPRIPDSVLNGDDEGWTQQGLAYDPATGLYLTTSYRDGEDGDDSRLSLIDGASGAEVNDVRLTSPSASDPVPAPVHSGGVAVHGDDVYVVSSESGGPHLYRYSLADLQAAEPGTEVPAVAKTAVPASSYVTVAEGKLYLGDFGNDALYSYPLDAVPALESGTYAGEPDQVTTPSGSNGVVIRPDQMIFAQNNGRAEGSSLITVPRDGSTLDLSHTHEFGLGNMAEEIELVDGNIVGITESGSELYSPWDDQTEDPDDLWGQTHMFELPLGVVTGAGYEVKPQTLRTASTEFDAATDKLHRITGRVATMQLVAWVLGEVDIAGQVSAAANRYLDQVAAALRTGVTAAESTAEGLLGAAGGYDDADGSAAQGFGALGALLPGG